jgi:hypothetical protein
LRCRLLPLQIVTRTTPVKRGLLHDPRVPEDCPADVRILIADCTKLIAADRPDTKVGMQLCWSAHFHQYRPHADTKSAHPLALCHSWYRSPANDVAVAFCHLQRVFDRLKASAAAHVTPEAAAAAPLLGAVPLSEAERHR